MDSNAVNIPAWPALLKPATAAAMLDMAPSTFTALWPILAARYGLRVIGLCGPKFPRESLLRVLDRLLAEDVTISVDKGRGIIRIGDENVPLKSTSTGKTRRGLQPRRNL